MLLNAIKCRFTLKKGPPPEMTLRDRHIITKGKIVFIMMVIFGGTIIMALGSITYLSHPILNYDSEYPSVLLLQNGKHGHMDIKFQSLNGLMPYNGITANVDIKIPEVENNTTKLMLRFDNARMMNPTDIPHQAEAGKSVIFTYNGTISGISTYSAKPYLVYYQPGQYAADIFVDDKNGTAYQNFGTVIEIGSWDSYNVKQNEINSKGLGWMVGGLALISTASVWTKLSDLFYEVRVLKRKRFYE